MGFAVYAVFYGQQYLTVVHVADIVLPELNGVSAMIWLPLLFK